MPFFKINQVIQFYLFNFINYIYILTFLLLFKYSFLPFPPTPPHYPSPPHLLPLFSPLLVTVHVSFVIIPVTLSPHHPLFSLLWSLSTCSQFQCLWLYFACSFC